MESDQALSGRPVHLGGPGPSIFDTAEIFKAVAHPVRARILELLSHGGSTIPELCEGTGVKASHLSRHLTQMRGQHLVQCLRSEGHLIYRLAYPEAAELLTAARAVLQARTAAAVSSLKPGPMQEGPAATALWDEQFSALEESLASRKTVADACQAIAARTGCSLEEAAGKLLMAARVRSGTLLEAARQELRNGQERRPT